jgi:hypothetical protein
MLAIERAARVVPPWRGACPQVSPIELRRIAGLEFETVKIGRFHE